MSRGAFNSRSLPSVVPLTHGDQSEQRNLVFPQILVIRLNHVWVTLAVESHREGTVLGRFFPTEAVRSWI